MRRSKILIADDAELNRDILTAMLGDEYDFAYACDGVEAIEVLSSLEEIDLVLLDMNMPNKNGFDVLRAMNEQNWIETIPVIVISAETSTDFIEGAYKLGVIDYIGRPFNSLVVQRRVENTLIMYSKQKRLIRQVEKQVVEREKISNSMINIFSDIIETRNHESGTHTLNVQTITNLLLGRLCEITDRYGITKSDVSLYSTLSALHDIGKIKVPEEILNKPGKLNDEEWVIMKAHTTEGDKILSSPELDQDSKFVRVARSICRWHHEKYDGGGYPDGLVGDDIPIAAQVVSMADVYDALTSERCYKKAFSHEKAIEMILGGECGVFNPLLLQCLQDTADTLKSLLHVKTRYDYTYDALSTANEILSEEELPKESILHDMLQYEHVKKDFFMECGDGVLFEYDKVLDKIVVADMGDGETTRRTEYVSRDNADGVLPVKFWDAFRDQFMASGRDNPEFAMDVELNLDGEMVPHRMRAKAIWPETGDCYVSIVGQVKRL